MICLTCKKNEGLPVFCQSCIDEEVLANEINLSFEMDLNELFVLLPPIIDDYFLTLSATSNGKWVTGYERNDDWLEFPQGKGGTPTEAMRDMLLNFKTKK